MQPRKANSWNHDSVKAYYAMYRDSVAVDYDVSEMRYIYVHKDADYSVDTPTDYDSLAHDLQYYVVPAFIAIIFAYLVFGSLLMNDNAKAQRRGDRGTILGMVNKSKNERTRRI